MKLDRRSLMTGGLALGASACVPPGPGMVVRLNSRLRLIEASANGSLGASIYDPGTGTHVSHNGFARFPHCSSFKLSLAALVLKSGHDGVLDIDERIGWDKDALLSHSPFTTERLSEGATLMELAAATQVVSDNTAANLLLSRVGGPEGLTAFWRAIGDEKSRLDRYEPELNHVPIGELFDTTTPDAMARTVSRLLREDVIDSGSRSILRGWMIDTQTGLDRVRAALPEGWIAGDKTGTSLWPGMRSVYVDIGFVEPLVRGPLTYAVYFRANEQHLKAQPAALAVFAEVGRVITRIVAGETA